MCQGSFCRGDARIALGQVTDLTQIPLQLIFFGVDQRVPLSITSVIGWAGPCIKDHPFTLTLDENS